MKHTRQLVVAAVFALTAGAAQAVSVNTFTACDELSPDATEKLTDNDGCVGLTSLFPASTNPGLSDFDGMFGVTGWIEIAKFNILKQDPNDEDSPPAPVNGDASGFSFVSTSTDPNFAGTWSISQSLLNMYGSLAIVMKDGNQLPVPSLAYLVSDVGGIWSTPWIVGVDADDPNNSLSNVRLIAADLKVPEIPLPAAGWLLLAGLGGLAAYGRKKRWA